MKTTRYFQEDILGGKRSYIKREWCEAILRNPEYTEAQEDGRIRHWGYIEEIGKFLRVVTLENRETVHNAMPDRSYTPRQRRET